MPEKGFTATFASLSGKTLRQFRITGWKLLLLRILLAVLVLLFSSAAVVVMYGLLSAGEISRMRREVSDLHDSLALRRSLEARLERVERQFEYLFVYRRKLENMVTVIPADGDPSEENHE